MSHYWNFLIFFFHFMQVIWYPLFGQVYALANHLRIDRSNPTAAIESLNEVSCSFHPHSMLDFVCNLDFLPFSCSGSSGSCEKKTFFEHISRGHQVNRWTTSPLQKGNFINLIFFSFKVCNISNCCHHLIVT